ncbi:hypothetical protein BH20ACT11_BH20ACT11_05180 [soil metagenome]
MMFIDAYWWTRELEDKQQAHYAAMMVSATAGKRLVSLRYCNAKNVGVVSGLSVELL